MATVANTGNDHVQRLQGGELRLGGRSGRLAAFSLASQFAYRVINDCQVSRSQTLASNSKKLARSDQLNEFAIGYASQPGTPTSSNWHKPKLQDALKKQAQYR